MAVTDSEQRGERRPHPVTVRENAAARARGARSAEATELLHICHRSYCPLAFVRLLSENARRSAAGAPAAWPSGGGGPGGGPRGPVALGDVHLVNLQLALRAHLSHLAWPTAMVQLRLVPLPGRGVQLKAWHDSARDARRPAAAAARAPRPKPLATAASLALRAPPPDEQVEGLDLLLHRGFLRQQSLAARPAALASGFGKRLRQAKSTSP